MSAFRELLTRAMKAGCTGVSFHASLVSYEEDNEQKKPWSCWLEFSPLIPHRAEGRTGEEALREAVTWLEKLGT